MNIDTDHTSILQSNRNKNRNRLLLFIIILVSVLFASQASNLKINATPYFLDDSHSSRKADLWVKDTFSNSGEVMMMATITQQPDIFNFQSLSEIKDLTIAIENLSLTSEADIDALNSIAVNEKSTALANRIIKDGFSPKDQNLIPGLIRSIDASIPLGKSQISYLNDLSVRLRPVRKIRNVVRVESITSIDNELDIHPMMYNLPTNEQELSALKKEALSNPLLKNVVFSNKPNAVNNFIELNIEQYDAVNMRRFYTSIDELIQNMKLSDEYHLGGPPAIFAQTSTVIKQDSDKLFPAIFLVVMIVLYALFKDIRSVYIPLLVAVLSVIWTLGTMAFFGFKQNIVSTIMPVFLISIGVADSIHYLTEYRRQLIHHPHQTALKLALKHLWKPMLMTTVTTIVGFLSLAYTEISFIKEFGFFVALGVLYAYIITVSLLPALLAQLKEKPEQRTSESRIDGLVEACIKFNTQLVLNHRKRLYIITALLVLPVVFAFSQLKIDNQMIGYFDEDSKLFKDNEAIKEHFSGSASIEFTLQASDVDFFKKPEAIRLLEELEKTVLETPHVNAVYGLTSFLKLVNREITDGSSEQFSIPYDNAALIPQYYLLYESSNGDDINSVVDASYRNARMVAFVDSDQTSIMSNIEDTLRAKLKSLNIENVSLLTHGFGNVLINTRNEVIDSQIFSLGLSFIGIFILLSALFKSVSIGVVGIIPLTFTVLINFAFMSAMGMYLDVGTSIVAPIAIGVGVDYAIYFLHSLKYQQSQLNNMEEAVRISLKDLYRPIGFNTLVLGLGFLVLNLSNHESLVNLGMLISSTMLFSAIITLTLIPAITTSLDLFSNKQSQDTAQTQASHHQL